MKNKICFASVLMVIVLSVGCISQTPAGGKDENVVPKVNNFNDCVNAGYPVMESYPRQCSTPDGRTFTEEVSQCVASGGAAMSLLEARQIAENSECAMEGNLENTSFCNANTGTWWIDFDAKKAGCNPACVVSVEEKKAEINWRCTGLLSDKHVCTEEERKAEACTMEYAPVCGENEKTYGNGCMACASGEIDFWMQDACPDEEIAYGEDFYPDVYPDVYPDEEVSSETLESETCAAETGETMDIYDALTIVDESDCAQEGIVTMDYSCNSQTGTWWINIEPLVEKEGCNPACVVNIKTKKAGVEWRCTGLLPPVENMEEEVCVAVTGENMSLDEALEIVDESECAQEGIVTMDYSCNKETGTWWVDIEPLADREDCNPACVINIKTKNAGVNWRCTGALPEPGGLPGM